jgi:hypothetical protein
MRQRMSLLGVGVVVALCLLIVAPVAAASLSPPCSLMLSAVDAAGVEVDSASLPGDRGSVDDPFRVAWDGTVDYEFDSGTPLRNNRSHVAVFGIPTMRASETEPAESTESGTVTVGEGWPVRFAGLAYVSGEITGDEGSCSGDGWVKVVGEPIGSIGWLLGALLIVLGLALLPFSLKRPTTVRVES